MGTSCSVGKGKKGEGKVKSREIRMHDVEGEGVVGAWCLQKEHHWQQVSGTILT
jgi:hypothetical protein